MNKTAQDIAKSMAKQIANEPLEILKDAGEQMVGGPTPANVDFPRPDQETPDVQAEQDNLQDKTFANRRIQALQKEIGDIEKHDLVTDLQAKISQGEEIPLEDYPGLSMEEKQVLKAQMEAFKIRRQEAQYSEGVGEVPTIHSKPSRRFGAGQKHEAEKQQTRVEKPVPPSG